MSLKYFKRIFIAIIILLTIAGIYIIYIKDNGKTGDVQAQNRETKIIKEILIGITDFDTINPILTKNLEIQHYTACPYCKCTEGKECNFCNNQGFVGEKELVTVNIPQRTKNNDKIIIKGYGNKLEEDEKRGDLHIKIHIWGEK